MDMYLMDSRVQFHRQRHFDRALAEMGQKIDYAIDVEVPDENIVNRMSGRRACVDCGATYHIVYAPTAKRRHLRQVWRRAYLERR